MTPSEMADIHHSASSLRVPKERKQFKDLYPPVIRDRRRWMTKRVRWPFAHKTHLVQDTVIKWKKFDETTPIDVPLYIQHDETPGQPGWIMAHPDILFYSTRYASPCQSHNTMHASTIDRSICTHDPECRLPSLMSFYLCWCVVSDWTAIIGEWATYLEHFHLVEADLLTAKEYAILAPVLTRIPAELSVLTYVVPGVKTDHAIDPNQSIAYMFHPLGYIHFIHWFMTRDCERAIEDAVRTPYTWGHDTAPGRASLQMLFENEAIDKNAPPHSLANLVSVYSNGPTYWLDEYYRLFSFLGPVQFPGGWPWKVEDLDAVDPNTVDAAGALPRISPHHKYFRADLAAYEGAPLSVDDEPTKEEVEKRAAEITACKKYQVNIIDRPPSHSNAFTRAEIEFNKTALDSRRSMYWREARQQHRAAFIARNLITAEQLERDYSPAMFKVVDEGSMIDPMEHPYFNDMVRAIRTFVLRSNSPNQTQRNILLYGGPGQGKTFMVRQSVCHTHARMRRKRIQPSICVRRMVFDSYVSLI
jgi:hypothetical protein